MCDKDTSVELFYLHRVQVSRHCIFESESISLTIARISSRTVPLPFKPSPMKNTATRQ